MESMNKDLWGIIKGTETKATQPNKLIQWKNRDDEAKSIIRPAISYSKLHHVDLDKFCKEI